MKRIVKAVLMFLGAGVVLAVGIFAFVFMATGGAADSANGLFAQIADGDVRGAYEATAPSAQRANSFEEFESAVRTLGLDQFVEASWNSREISGDRAELSGTVTLEDGSAVPLDVTLVKSDDVWQVTGFSSR